MSYYDRDRNVRKADGTFNAPGDKTVAGTMNHPYTHHGNVAEYQASGIPFVQYIDLQNGNLHRIDFPFVTQWVQVFVERAHKVFVAFSVNGSQGESPGTNYIPIENDTGTSNSPLTNVGNVWRVKCKELYVRSGESDGAKVYVVAGLTNVPAADFPDMSAIIGVGAAATVTDLST